MAPTKIPTHDELVDKVTDLIPLLRSHAGWAEDNRRLHDEVIEALADAGVFKLRRPERFGGYNVDTDTLVDVGTVLGQGCGSTSWVASVYWIPTGWPASSRTRCRRKCSPRPTSGSAAR